MLAGVECRTASAVGLWAGSAGKAMQAACSRKTPESVRHARSSGVTVSACVAWRLGEAAARRMLASTVAFSKSFVPAKSSSCSTSVSAAARKRRVSAP